VVWVVIWAVVWRNMDIDTARCYILLARLSSLFAVGFITRRAGDGSRNGTTPDRSSSSSLASPTREICERRASRKWSLGHSSELVVANMILISRYG
jgi:hypothetical protein